MYYSWKGLCSGHGNAVVIRELSLYPQSLLAKLTVYGKEELLISQFGFVNGGPSREAIREEGKNIFLNFE